MTGYPADKLRSDMIALNLLSPTAARRVYQVYTLPGKYRPHQGSKETARRQRQQHKAAFHKCRDDLNGILNGFAGRENSPEVREEITRAVVAYVEAQTEFREIAQMMENWILEKLGVAGEAEGKS